MCMTARLQILKSLNAVSFVQYDSHKESFVQPDSDKWQ
jgi:hypothetical protein